MAKHTKPVVKETPKAVPVIKEEEAPIVETEAPVVEEEAPVVEEEAPKVLYTANIGLTNPYTLQRFEPGLKTPAILDSWTVCQIEAGIIFPC